MEKKQNELDKIETIRHNLNEIISDGSEIKRQDILDAEEVSFNKVPPLSVIYDEYGFVNNKENTKNK